MAKTIEQIQAMITGLAEPREIINELADYLQANPGGSGGVGSVTAGDESITVGGTATNPTVALPYKVYTALLSQSGVDAPVAIVLENTLSGEPVWTRNGIGDYRMTLNGAFTLNKTYIPGFEFISGYIGMSISNSTVADYYYIITRVSANVIALNFIDSSYSLVEMSTALGENPTNQLSLPEIRVYP